MSREDIVTEGKMTLTYLLVSEVKRAINYTLQQLHQLPKKENYEKKMNLSCQIHKRYVHFCCFYCVRLSSKLSRAQSRWRMKIYHKYNAQNITENKIYLHLKMKNNSWSLQYIGEIIDGVCCLLGILVCYVLKC